MAAVATPAAIVRAPREGEGTSVARLWRELWDVHESWGGYPGEHDADGVARVGRVHRGRMREIDRHGPRCS